VSILSAILLYVLMVAGFLGAGWCTDTFFRLFRKNEESGPIDAILALSIWGGLFGSFGYIVTGLLR
jgi:hypothetical protein